MIKRIGKLLGFGKSGSRGLRDGAKPDDGYCSELKDALGSDDHESVAFLDFLASLYRDGLLSEEEMDYLIKQIDPGQKLQRAGLISYIKDRSTRKQETSGQTSGVSSPI